MASVLKNLVYQMVGVLIIIFVLSGFAFAENDENVKISIATKNLLVGMKSENDGLRRSSIYFVGKYKIVEAINALSEQLAKEDDANTRILIALSLYQIGSSEGLTAIKKAATNDEDAKVRRICSEIYNALFENGYSLSLEKENN